MQEHVPYQTRILAAYPEQGAHRALCRLLLYLQPRRVFAVWTGPEEQLMACHEYIGDPGLSPLMFLRLLLDRETLLREPYVEVRVYLGETPFTLLPAGQLTLQDRLRVTRLLLDDLAFEEELLELPVEAAGALLLTTLDPGLRHLLRQYLRHFWLGHLAQLAIPLALRLAGGRNAILLLPGDSGALMTAVRHGRLHFCNQLPVYQPDDQQYFLETVFQLCELGPETPLWALGETGGTPEPFAHPDLLSTWASGAEAYRYAFFQPQP